MSDKVKRARGVANLACPCRLPNITITNGCGGLCHCTIGYELGSACFWSGHSAIDSLILAVGEEVRERAAETCEAAAGLGSNNTAAYIRSLPLDDMVKP